MATTYCYSASPSPRLESPTRARSGEPNRGHLREEPYAGKPHVRICEGKAEWPSYSTTLAARCSLTTLPGRRIIGETPQGKEGCKCSYPVFGRFTFCVLLT